MVECIWSRRYRALPHLGAYVDHGGALQRPLAKSIFTHLLTLLWRPPSFRLKQGRPEKESKMKQTRFGNLRFASVVVLVLTLSSAAFAGPALICHTIDIGNAKSLPWISENWK